ncbi:MAG: CpaF family protein [Acidimicrobiales bacterium]|nr:CpaF family protein [Acidimicrobiales bacterium]
MSAVATGLAASVHAEALDLLAAAPGGDQTAIVEALVARREPLLGVGARDAAVAAVMARITGLGPLQPLLSDPAVSEVMVNGPGPVFIERSGRLEATDIRLDDAEVQRLVERVIAPSGRRVDRSSPWVDARLADGSRVNVVVPPIAIDGPCVTIRRFGERRFTLADLAAPEVAVLLGHMVADRANIIVSGATGSGKTTLLAALTSAVDPTERLITVEDAAELALATPHVVRLEARPPNCEGVGEVTVRDLVRNALRMRPDRIVVGEVRGAEAFDMLQALNTGHDGSLSTCHANSATDALRRLSTMVLLASPGLSPGVAEALVAGSVDLVVHMTRQGASRLVSDVVEVRPPGEQPPFRSVVVDGGPIHAQPPSGRWGR